MKQLKRKSLYIPISLLFFIAILSVLIIVFPNIFVNRAVAIIAHSIILISAISFGILWMKGK